MRVLYEEIARTCGALGRSRESGNVEWIRRYEAWLEYIEKNLLPSGSGFDSGTKIDQERSHDERVVLTTAFHHMDENGFYDGWTEHEVTVVPSFVGGFRLRVGGRNRNDIKEYISYVINQDLCEDVDFEWVHFMFEGIPAVSWNDDHLMYEVNVEGEVNRFDTVEAAKRWVVDWAKQQMKQGRDFRRREM